MALAAKIIIVRPGAMERSRHRPVGGADSLFGQGEGAVDVFSLGSDKPI